MIGTVSSSRRRFLRSGAATAASGLFAGCVRRSALPAPRTAPSSGFLGPDSLKAHAALHGLFYGCAVNVGRLRSDAEYEALVREQASILVAENEMKWASLRPSPSTFHFETADALVAYAEQHRIKVRGHNLCWHRQLPQWFAAAANPGNARALLTGHIERVAGRYAGRMHSWDVVNEAIQIEDGRPDGLRQSAWLELIGPEYIELAFRTARLADPQALLAYNDYGIEDDSPGAARKRSAMLELLRRLKARDVPIDAVGIQSHIAAGRVYGEPLRAFLAEIRGLGLQVFLTEMDVNDRALPPDAALRDQAVAAAYESYLNLALGDPAVHAALTWGITDRYTWLNGEDARADRLPERCLPFDRECNPKTAFFAMRNAFDRRTVA